jgi:hypothetical protein
LLSELTELLVNVDLFKTMELQAIATGDALPASILHEVRYSCFPEGSLEVALEEGRDERCEAKSG